MKVYVTTDLLGQPTGVYFDYQTALNNVTSSIQSVNSTDAYVRKFPVLTEVSTEVFDDADVK